jgi:hypothetical protein
VEQQFMFPVATSGAPPGAQSLAAIEASEPIVFLTRRICLDEHITPGVPQLHDDVVVKCHERALVRRAQILHRHSN